MSTLSRSFPKGRLAVWLRHFILTITILSSGLATQAQETLLTNGATWRWRKGTNEVSTPNTLWRGNGFNDSTWSVGAAPFHYGESLADGTLLNDMQNGYTCVFLRIPFVVTNVNEIGTVQLTVNYDDGFVAWINGTEVARLGVTNPAPAFNNNASISHEATPAELVPVAIVPGNYLVSGTNTLAVQAFNVSLGGSTDFRFDTSLQVTKINPPIITNAIPAANTTVSALTEVTVLFNKPTSGVDAADLLLNDQPASAVTGVAGTNRYTFTFTQPAFGLVGLTWSDTSGITDLTGSPFDPTAASANWTYTLTDGIAPVIAQRSPVSGATVSALTQVELLFSEPVSGVNASDLLINGSPAASVTGVEAGPYVFIFAQPASGTVNFSWAGAHGIADLAANPFVATNWSLMLNPALAPGDIIINEFVAGNINGLADEDAEKQDWIELYNRGTNAVNLLGWSLTDDADVPGLWTFPSKILNPGEYLVVFASEKNRTAPTGTNKFHTNFKLDLFGDYLALYNAEYPRGAVSEFTPQFPEQRNDYSYGRDTTNAFRYFQTPTPGAANGSSAIVGVAPEPHFSVSRGLFDVPFDLLLTTTIPGATIRYTTDGSEPTLANGATYSTPLAITNTTIIRAAAFATGYVPSRVRTHSYIYLESVLTQPNNPLGFPSTWGTAANFPGNIVPADYEMDSDPLRVDPYNSGSAIDPVKLQRFKDGLRELPIVSLVLNRDDMFGPNGLYPKSSSGNKNPNEKAVSLEMLMPDGSTAFVVNGGLDLHGNASRDPFKNPKHGFKLNLKGEYGESSLDYKLFPDSPAEKFDDLILRPDFGVSWRHQTDTSTEGFGAFQRTRASRFRDAWMKHTQRDMGGPSGFNLYTHLFINGLYWGTYDFAEQPTGQFAENYLPASTNGYDIYDQGGVVTTAGGNAVAYNAMLAVTGLATNANYELLKQYLNITEFSDYMLLSFWGGAQDWGNNKNWYAVRPRVAGPDGTFQYVVWDGENYLMNENINRVPNGGGSTDVPSGLFTKLDDNPQFRLDFADRVHKHMIAPGGALTREANTARWQYWQALLDKPIVVESCRWGDYRRDVHQYTSGVFDLYTRENQWLIEMDRIVNSYFVNRPGIVMSQLTTAGLYPLVAAPEYRQTTTAGTIIGSGSVAAGSVVAMNNPGGAGTIYYTTNGSDPRVYYSGTIAASALTYSTPLTLNSTVTLKSRVFSGGVWSALNEATFTVGELGLPLRITEIMYNPIGGDAYEFIEIQNVGALPLNIGGFSFQGITYIVPLNTILQPGATLLLANNANPAQFATRYPSASVFGYFSGNLSNGGERIAILDANGNTVVAVHYDDENGWPTSPDGGGYSLEIIDPRGDPNAPANWRASSAANGTPGLPPVAPALGTVVINEVAADNATSVSNGGLFPDWIELRNTGGSATNIAGWSLTDNSNARQFVFPANTIIAAGGYLTVWCDSATNDPGLHTLFSLAKNGETISLFDANTNRTDAITFGLQITDKTVGRIGSDWQLTAPTPGNANLALSVASSTNIAINEWLADPGVGGQDWLELFNRSSTAPVALRGLYLGTSNSLFHYTALSFLPPRGYAQLFCEELPGADQLEFKLPASGGAIFLSSATGAELERITYAAQTASVSQGRLPDGTASITTFPGSTSPGSTNYLLAYTGPALNEILARNDRAVVSPWGDYADFVELYNASGSSVSLAGMALGDSADFGDAWKFPAGTTIAAGGYLTIWCDSSHSASTSAGGPHNTGFSLAGDSGAIYLFNTSGQPVDWITHGFQVEDLSIGRSGGVWCLLATPTPGAANSAIATLGTASSLRFNEWMPAPLTGDDWFELYNTNALPVDLSNLYLTDNPSSSGLTNSPIAPLSFIGGRKWVKFVADSNVESGGDHAGFNLDALGETLRLYTTNLSLVEVMDFGVQTDGVSQGRLPDGNSTIVSFPTTPTPDAANYLPLTNVVINEILTHTDPPLEDAVEFFNPTASSVNIGGWFLSDSQSDLKRYRIPDGTTIPAGGFKVFYQNQFGPADGETDSPPLFTFNSAHGDAVYLSQADASTNLTGYRIGQSFDAAANGVSFGRYQTSVGTDFVSLSQRTFGADNPATLAQFRTGTGLANAYPLVGPIVISEIMYHPPDYGTNSPDDEEFIELLNISGATVSLFDPAHPTNTWRLAGGVSFDFATNQTIAAGARLVVVGFNPTNTTLLNSFRARFGTNNTIVGPYAGQLANSGESVELWRPDAPQSAPPDAGFVPQLLVERIAYSAVSPWPTNADGFGPSLQRVTASSYGNDPVNWEAAWPTAGGTAFSPPNPPTGSASLPGDGVVRLTFAVQPGYQYQVEYKDNLSDPIWLPLGAPSVATANALIIDEPLTNAPQRFYRLIAPTQP